MHKSSSINEKELEKFNKNSNQWWDINGEFKILHQINPIRLSYIIGKIKSHFSRQETNMPFANLDILDVGCGGGLITQPLYKLGAHITGIDVVQNNIDVAKKHAEEHNLKINYIQSTVEELLYISNIQYDVVLCLEVIEHIDNSSNFIKNLARLVKSNGMIIISTINRNIKSYLLAILMAEYILGLVAKKTHDHSKFLKPSEIYSMFSKNHMEIKELKGLTYSLATRVWQLSDNIDVNYFAYIVQKENY